MCCSVSCSTYKWAAVSSSSDRQEAAAQAKTQKSTNTRDIKAENENADCASFTTQRVFSGGRSRGTKKDRWRLNSSEGADKSRDRVSHQPQRDCCGLSLPFSQEQSCMRLSTHTNKFITNLLEESGRGAPHRLHSHMHSQHFHFSTFRLRLLHVRLFPHYRYRGFWLFCVSHSLPRFWFLCSTRSIMSPVPSRLGGGPSQTGLRF